MIIVSKLFVGNLSYSMTSDGLRAVFAKCGDVTDANVVMDKQTGRSRGFGFVEMKTDDDAKKAIAELNETEVESRKMYVSEAKPKADNN